MKESRRRFWNAVLALASAANLVAVWPAARAGEPLHAAIHVALAVAFGLWALHRMRLGGGLGRARALDWEGEIAALRSEVDEVRGELGEMQERLDFAERLLSQAREVERLPRRES